MFPVELQCSDAPTSSLGRASRKSARPPVWLHHLQEAERGPLLPHRLRSEAEGREGSHTLRNRTLRGAQHHTVHKFCSVVDVHYAVPPALWARETAPNFPFPT